MRNKVALGLVYLSFFSAYVQALNVLFRGVSTIRRKAFDASCQRHGCRNLECKNDAGWNIYGHDIGCCGNYDGCCTLATKMCYLHDQMCQCCSFGWLVCGPDCKPEPHCSDSQGSSETISKSITSAELSPKHQSAMFTTHDHSQGDVTKPTIIANSDDNNSHTKDITVTLTSADLVSSVDNNITFGDYHHNVNGGGMTEQQWNITGVNNQTQKLDSLTDTNKYSNESLLDGGERNSSNQTLSLDNNGEGSGEIP